MKILYVTNMYPDMVQGLPYAGIFVKEQIEAVERCCPDCKTKTLVIDGASSKLNYLKSIAEIRNAINRYQPDIIHVHYGLSAIFLLFFPHYGSRTIVTLHGGDIMPQQKKWIQVFLTRKSIKHAAWVIVLNKQMEKAVDAITPCHSTIKCGVDTDFFQCEKQLCERPDEKVLIFPADPDRRVKNYALFQEAVDYIGQKMGVPPKVITLNNMSRADIREALCTADCMLLTSISEGSPQVIKEAMSCNLPIVSVDVGDVKDVLSGLYNCHVVTSRSANKLGDQIISLFEDNRRSSGRSRIMKLGLDNDAIAQSLLVVYHRICGRETSCCT